LWPYWLSLSNHGNCSCSRVCWIDSELVDWLNVFLIFRAACKYSTVLFCSSTLEVLSKSCMHKCNRIRILPRRGSPILYSRQCVDALRSVSLRLRFPTPWKCAFSIESDRKSLLCCLELCWFHFTVPVSRVQALWCWKVWRKDGVRSLHIAVLVQWFEKRHGSWGSKRIALFIMMWKWLH
jgi:hypothetical protein